MYSVKELTRNGYRKEGLSVVIGMIICAPKIGLTLKEEFLLSHSSFYCGVKKYFSRAPKNKDYFY